jgi:hypothetical protein
LSITYKLEVWGAQGGTVSGGKGGYSFGKYNMSENNSIYVIVGQGGYTRNFGLTIMETAYNGGGYGQEIGGGATHIATTNRGVLANYKNYQSEVIIVAGGGGGNEGSNTGGAGGGTKGGDGSINYAANPKHPMTKAPTGGTQTSGGTAGESSEGIAYSGSFGQGGHGTLQAKPMQDAGGGGGGGGWYGGGGQTYAGAGGGGSGHLGSSLISGTAGMQSGVNSGNGKALVTWMPVL